MEDRTARNLGLVLTFLLIVVAAIPAAPVVDSWARGVTPPSTDLIEAILIFALAFALGWFTFPPRRVAGYLHRQAVQPVGETQTETLVSPNDLRRAAVHIGTATDLFDPQSQKALSLAYVGLTLLNRLNQSIAAPGKAPNAFESQEIGAANSAFHGWTQLRTPTVVLDDARKLIDSETDLTSFFQVLRMVRDVSLDAIRASNMFAQHLKNTGPARVEKHEIEQWNDYKAAVGRFTEDLRQFGEEMKLTYKFEGSFYFPAISSL